MDCLSSQPVRLAPFRNLSMKVLLVLAMLAPIATQAADPPSKSWSGTWNNKKYKTTGPLTCTVTSSKGGNWQATFSGTGLGNPFSYPATLKAMEKGGRIYLAGSTKVDGEAYRWSGYIQGQVLAGSYKSATGNNGTFSLKSK